MFCLYVCYLIFLLLFVLSLYSVYFAPIASNLTIFLPLIYMRAIAYQLNVPQLMSYMH